jgi:hypothetical protein
MSFLTETFKTVLIESTLPTFERECDVLASHLEKAKRCPQRRQLALQFIQGLKTLYTPKPPVREGWLEQHSENMHAIESDVREVVVGKQSFSGQTEMVEAVNQECSAMVQCCPAVNPKQDAEYVNSVFDSLFVEEVKEEAQPLPS